MTTHLIRVAFRRIMADVAASQEAGAWSIEAFFAAWQRMDALLKDHLAEHFSSESILAEADGAWPAGLGDGTYAAWLRGQRERP